MPRYFFHIQHIKSVPDTEGVELADAGEAWKEATTSCGEMLRDLDGNLAPGPEWRMDVTDAKGQPMFNIRVNAEFHR